mmetsp:Transcript_110778/g.277330  ORF Transcript_110778/g.277330 Transcript_110778/m.277330 type:complete len:200 (+) Transcript_110778:745-1344(+)
MAARRRMHGVSSTTRALQSWTPLSKVAARLTRQAYARATTLQTTVATSAISTSVLTQASNPRGSRSTPSVGSWTRASLPAGIGRRMSPLRRMARTNLGPSLRGPHWTARSGRCRLRSWPTAPSTRASMYSRTSRRSGTMSRRVSTTARRAPRWRAGIASSSWVGAPIALRGCSTGRGRTPGALTLPTVDTDVSSAVWTC